MVKAILPLYKIEPSQGQRKQLLRKNSPWVHAIHAHIRYRMMLGLHCITDEQIERKEIYQSEYGKWCMKITEKYGYNFDFLKQHHSHHSSADIRVKGVPSVYCTRVNEGHHQETRDAYGLRVGNHRNNDRHVTQVDATKEAMARIRMTVDEYDKELKEHADDVTRMRLSLLNLSKLLKKQISAMIRPIGDWDLAKNWLIPGVQ
ncbi:hypothetical protein DFH08DRAFT_1021639 [Mycena albidolilacea]|uniref:Uncharacterized protein n=1 Tax=Mycena albidolilacea TaxID=1033008 RepID=A0AAD6ZNV3_9AGAR|nr:hypothetical protein DFH08DRAFT_1021639 [Mycena albidolilacea]